MLKKLILKEYGSWSVVCLSFLAAMAVLRWRTESTGLLLLVGILPFINSKQALVGWIKRGDRQFLFFFVIQILISLAVFTVVFGKNTANLIPLATIPLLYAILLYRYGEHHLSTELVGFGVLCLPTALVLYKATDILSIETYLGVWLFFAASVFKVRVHLKKQPLYRWAMGIYCLLVVALYPLLEFPLIASLPLIDNLLFSILLYNVRLKITGWIELFKGITFLVLLSL